MKNAYNNAADKIAYLEKHLGVKQDLIRAANLDAEQLDSIFNRAVKNEHFRKRYIGPAALLTAGLFCAGMASTYVPAIKTYETYILLAFAPTAFFFVFGSDRATSRNEGLRAEIRRAADAELLRLKNGPTNPQP